MKTILTLFGQLFQRFPLHFITLSGLVFLQALVNILTIIAIAPITDFLMNRTGPEANPVTHYYQSFLSLIGLEFNLLSVILFCTVLTVLYGLTGVATQYAVLRIKYSVLLHIITDTIGEFFRARFQFFSQGNMGDLLNTFQQEMRKVGDTFGQIAQLLANLMHCIIFVIVAFFLSFTITLTFVLTAGLLSIPLLMLRRYTYFLGKANTTTANTMAGIIHESFTAAKLFIGFGRQATVVQRYREAFLQHAEVTSKFQTLENTIGGFMFFPLGIIAALGALYIAYLDGIPLSSLAMVLFTLLRLIPLMGQLMRGKTSVEGFVPAYEQIEGLRQQAATVEEPKGEIRYHALKNEIQFENVWFSYVNRQPALKGISLTIPRRKSVALVGQSGAGKTTVVDLIMGLYCHDTGAITIDGISINEYDLNTLRNRIGYVPQEPQLFNTSVRENLLWAYPEAEEIDIWEACRLANAQSFVEELPQALDTPLGERGIQLSGGQRQRLALARAIIRKPDILILDEATSALDTESERLIQQALESLAAGMTIVIIAHRLSTIKNVDYVYVLDKGEIVEQGTYPELSKKPDGRLGSMLAQQSL